MCLFGWLVCHWVGAVGVLVCFVWFCCGSNFTSVLNLFASKIKHIVRIKTGLQNHRMVMVGRDFLRLSDRPEYAFGVEIRLQNKCHNKSSA